MVAFLISNNKCFETKKKIFLILIITGIIDSYYSTLISYLIYIFYWKKNEKYMANLQKAYLGMQCFWGAESTFAKLNGVLATRVGYAGGTTTSPNYYNIGDHTEVTEIQFDEKIISYDEILNCFWDNHNPIKEYKKQYKSAILYVDDQQKETAKNSLKKIQEKYGDRKLDTYVQKLIHFYQAEDYHQKYWLRCQTAIFKKLNLNNEQVVNSLLATKVNAFLAGYKNFDVLKQLADQYGLDDDVVKLIEGIAITGGDTSACHV
ncbi:Peptide methionine sulfoxide reductase [Dirofilaria immitis]